MKIMITTKDNKKYTLSEGLYAIDGTWLFEDNKLTGRKKIELLENCKIDINLEKKHKVDLDKYLCSQAEKALKKPFNDENDKVIKTLEKHFNTKAISKALAKVMSDKNKL